MRRLRRRSSSSMASPNPLFCRTNGCASLLVLDATTGVATCEICGFTRLTN
jgi:hypothetical protein